MLQLCFKGLNFIIVHVFLLRNRFYDIFLFISETNITSEITFAANDQ
jgi:hypothetical protein